MRECVRRLFQPTPTSPTEPFTWSDSRPIRAQIIGGVRKSVGLIGGFAVLIGLFGGMLVLSDSQTRGSGEIAFSAGMLVVAIAVMFATANAWAPFVTGFFFGPAILRIAFALLLGPGSFQTQPAFSRRDAAELLFFALAVVATTVRFVDKRPAPTTPIDRLALTFFAVAMVRQILIPYQFPPWPVLSGLAALLIAWLASRRRSPGTARGPRRTVKRRRMKTPPPIVR